MLWIILGFVLLTAIALIAMVALSQVGDEPGAHRFGEETSPDTRAPASGFDHGQNTTAAAMQMAEKKDGGMQSSIALASK